MSKVLLGLSGGVDSAVAAALLQQQGYAVHGHWLDIGLGGREDAEAVAARFEIAFSVGDIREDLENLVCKPFGEAYLRGETPLPCARCNPAVKFPALLRAADSVGAAFVATGHYARIVGGADSSEAFLHRGQPTNDQAYMLARLTKDMLPRLIFPLGDYEKSAVRQMARDFSIPVAEKPDSMEICFIPDGDYAAWLDRRGGTPPPGNFLDKAGKVLGQHRGYHHYTKGQRRGLTIAAGSRLFVSEIRPETNEVILSDGSDLFATRVWCEDLNFLDKVEDGQEMTVRLRHSKQEYGASIRLLGDNKALLEMQTEARAPTAGQLAAFYDNDRVLGSGWITKEVK